MYLNSLLFRVQLFFYQRRREQFADSVLWFDDTRLWLSEELCHTKPWKLRAANVLLNSMSEKRKRLITLCNFSFCIFNVRCICVLAVRGWRSDGSPSPSQFPWPMISFADYLPKHHTNGAVCVVCAFAAAVQLVVGKCVYVGVLQTVGCCYQYWKLGKLQ